MQVAQTQSLISIAARLCNLFYPNLPPPLFFSSANTLCLSIYVHPFIIKPPQTNICCHPRTFSCTDFMENKTTWTRIVILRTNWHFDYSAGYLIPLPSVKPGNMRDDTVVCVLQYRGGKIKALKGVREGKGWIPGTQAMCCYMWCSAGQECTWQDIGLRTPDHTSRNRMSHPTRNYGHNNLLFPPFPLSY